MCNIIAYYNLDNAKAQYTKKAYVNIKHALQQGAFE